ncbi:MAG TPA: hypothetical protein VFA27_14125 [Vicinamibacterales bacterium]|nr:hypothetical protein [Vicinamibacterales bacterium]
MTVRAIAAISLVYDGVVGVLLLAGRPLLVQVFHVPPPQPPIHADLNGVFLLAVSLGYLIPYRDPDTRAGRGYLWVMGPFLKGLGAAAFLLDFFVRHSPSSFLIFAASDGTLALLTLWVLLSATRPRVS